MPMFEFWLGNDDFDRLFAIKSAQGKDEMTGNEFARELLESELHRLYFNYAGNVRVTEDKSNDYHKSMKVFEILNIIKNVHYVIIHKDGGIKSMEIEDVDERELNLQFDYFEMSIFRNKTCIEFHC